MKWIFSLVRAGAHKAMKEGAGWHVSEIFASVIRYSDTFVILASFV